MASDNFCLSMFFTKMLLLYWLVGGIQRRPDWRYVKLNSPQFYTVTVHKTQLALRQRNLKICLYHKMWLANSINLTTYREQKRNNRVQQCKKNYNRHHNRSQRIHDSRTPHSFLYFEIPQSHQIHSEAHLWLMKLRNTSCVQSVLRRLLRFQKLDWFACLNKKLHMWLNMWLLVWKTLATNASTNWTC